MDPRASRPLMTNGPHPHGGTGSQASITSLSPRRLFLEVLEAKVVSVNHSATTGRIMKAPTTTVRGTMDVQMVIRFTLPVLRGCLC